MNKFKLRLPVLLGAMAAIAAPLAQAELLEYSFNTPDGAERTLSPSTVYANPTGNIKFALSAGIDRKVKISIVRPDGSVVNSATSHLLGGTDRITVNGKSYYGAELSLAAPGEGEYTLKAEILSANGDSVQSDEYPINLDTTAPEYSGYASNGGGYGTVVSGDVWKLGREGSGNYAFILKGIEDESGIQEIRFKLRRADGSIHRDSVIGFDAASKQARMPYETIFPSSNLDEDFTIWFEITDQAGNTKETNRQTVRFDNYGGAPQSLFGVYDPDSNSSLGPGLEGFVAYEPGMEVKTNPIRVAFRVNKSNWHEYHEGGIRMTNALGENIKAGEDDKYVYIIASAPFGNTNGNYWRWVNFGEYGGGYVSYNLKLAPRVAESPNLASVEYNYSDKGWSSFYRQDVKNHELPINVSGVKVNVSPRPYKQIASHNGTCEIPAGETSCFIEWSTTLAKGTTGYLHANAIVRNEDNTLKSNARWPKLTGMTSTIQV
ncbi:DUF4165 domain-containing protein (plasmid) [Vibrio alginolyticus]